MLLSEHAERFLLLLYCIRLSICYNYSKFSCMKKVLFLACYFFSLSAFSQKAVSIETETFNRYFPTVEKGDTTIWFQDPCALLGVRVVFWCDTSIELYVFTKDSIGRIVRQDCILLYQDDLSVIHRYLVFEAKGVEYAYTYDGIPVGYATTLSDDRLVAVSQKVLEYFPGHK